MNTKRNPIICLDFDGVIHSYASGWRGAHVIPDLPVPGAIDAMFRYLNYGFDVAVFSSRSKSLRGRWAMKRWLGHHIRLHWEAGNSNPVYEECECWGDATSITRKFKWPWFKPPALVSIDDRGLTFNGDWASDDYSPTSIRNFKPWNKV